MEFVNLTPLPSELLFAPLDETTRAGVLVVKGTYRIGADGTFDMETDAPLPVLADDVETPDGLLPADVFVPGPTDALEVVVVGAAYTDKPSDTSVTVELRVGEELRRLVATGPRQWVGRGAEAAITPPAPFDRVSLDWSNAFGGKTDIAIDASSELPVMNAFNPSGVGLDVEPWVSGLERAGIRDAALPPVDHVRRLPRLESPEDRVGAWSDEPLPYTWATLPRDHGLLAKLRHDATRRGARAPRMSQRSHPDLTFDPAPAPGAQIELRGCSPRRRPLSFRMPTSGVVADYVAGDRTGTVPLTPQLMVLLPEEDRISVTYRAYFRCPYVEGAERAMRLRTNG